MELGKIWYFWVRLKKNENASMWTVPKYISLSSSPNVPTLELSKRYISLDEKFVATWTYVSTDNTPQSSASICICSVDGDSVTYGEIIASIPSDEITNPETQSMVLDPKSDKLSWMDGQDYYLAIRVVSGSGMMSDWSQYVPISVISPIDCSITYTSLYPNINEYDSEETYSVGDYVVHRMYDRTNNNIENGKIYKCISEISEAEYWDDSHWAIDQEMTYFELTSLPLEVEVDTGDRNDIRTTIIIERSEDYFVDRPDGGKYGGHAGDIVAQVTVQNNSDGPILIGTDELTDYLDDGAYYYLTVRITDNYGQSHEIRYEFIVNWSHQALMPTAEMDIDDVYNVAKIFVGDPESVYMLSTDTEVVEGTTYYIRTGEGTFEDPFVYEEVLNPTGSPVDNGWYYCADTVEDGDVCDIYRMSADGLELLYPNADFNETYVDPYPTIGERGGYRVVYKTVNGDYITPSMGFAWVDLDDGDILDSMSHIIDFDEGTVRLSYNVDLDNSWSKDFQETHYLGVSVVGDWNPGVSRTGSINANVVTSDWDVISSLRRLANYNGVCHVRTTDGSNYMANIDVSERVPYQTYTNPDTDIVKVYEYSLSLTRVDSIDYDGLTLAEWEERIADET